MPAYYHTFVHLLFISLIALFPVVNPIGSAFMVTPYFSHLSKGEQRKAVRRITVYAFAICTVAFFAGHWILELFGVTIPVIQLAGGIMICKMGWEFISGDNENGNDGRNEVSETPAKSFWYQDLENKLFYPITFPVTTGAGTLSVLFTLSAHSAASQLKDYLANASAVFLAIIIMCLLVYVFYINAKALTSCLGSKGEAILNRIASFLIFSVGLQIAATGIKSLFHVS